MRRIVIDVPPLAVLAAIAIRDAQLIQRHMPRDRIWLLVAYSLMPILLVVIASPFLRWRRFMPLLAAAAVPPLVRFVAGDATADRAFERLSLNPFWFALIYLPIALAWIVISEGRNLWRFGTAFLLMFVALTFTSKGPLSDDLAAMEIAVAVQCVILGLGFIIADLVPSRAAALQWLWLVMVAVSIAFIALGYEHVHDASTKRSILRSEIESEREVRDQIAITAARYEKQGRLTSADRAKIARHIADGEAKERQFRDELLRSRSPLAVSWTLLVPACAMLLLYAALFVQAWRARRRV